MYTETVMAAPMNEVTRDHTQVSRTNNYAGPLENGYESFTSRHVNNEFTNRLQQLQTLPPLDIYTK